MAKQHKLINSKRDWSDLPLDLVYLIAKKLPHLQDYVRFRATCKSWYSSTPLSDFPLHVPWLLEFHQKPNSTIISVPVKELCLYSISSGETLTIPMKETRLFRGTSNNYLPLIDDRTGTICLFNPLSKDEFVLPLILDTRKKFPSLMVGTEQGPIRDRRILIADHGESIMQGDRWAIYDPHDGKWSEQEGICIQCGYCQGMFFPTSIHSITEVFDASSKKLLYKIPPHEDETMNISVPGELPCYCHLFKSYIVDSSGEILRVCWYYPTILPNHKFQIYRLEFGVGGQPNWVKISDISDQIIFLEVLNEFFMTTNGFSMIAAHASGLKGGHIYFIDPFNGKPYMYDFATGTVETVSCPFEKCTWFVLGLD